MNQLTVKQFYPVKNSAYYILVYESIDTEMLQSASRINSFTLFKTVSVKIQAVQVLKTFPIIHMRTPFSHMDKQISTFEN